MVAVLLQKAEVARRIYAGLLNTGSNADGYKDEGITFPSREMQISLFKQVQNEVGVNATHLAFMEAHGSATKVSGRRIPRIINPSCSQQSAFGVSDISFVVCQGGRPSRSRRHRRSVLQREDYAASNRRVQVKHGSRRTGLRAERRHQSSRGNGVQTVAAEFALQRTEPRHTGPGRRAIIRQCIYRRHATRDELKIE